MKDMVTIICYGETEVMERKDAINKYLEGMMFCEGSEGERYKNIYFQLISGETVVSDRRRV